MQTTTTPSWSLSQLHLLMSGECNFECDHCFVWGGPSQKNTMTRETIEHVLAQAGDLGTIEWIYFEGGEPFLDYPLLLSSARLAKNRGFKVGIVSNAFWATTSVEAMDLLKPFSGIIDDLSISDDAYHGREEGAREITIARRAAKKLGIPVDFISITGPEISDSQTPGNQESIDEASVCYRGRAAVKLAPLVRPKSWSQFTRCPWEDLKYPKRVHIDSFGNMHICQGLSIGNLIEQPLAEIMRNYDPDTHPVIGPLQAGGPVELVKRFGLDHEDGYADACHLCYQARCELRDRFPDELPLDQMYGA